MGWVLDDGMYHRKPRCIWMMGFQVRISPGFGPPHFLVPATFTFPGGVNWKLGGGFIFFNFHPYLGKWSILTNIFQMGWNHQLVYLDPPFGCVQILAPNWSVFLGLTFQNVEKLWVLAKSSRILEIDVLQRLILQISQNSFLKKRSRAPFQLSLNNFRIHLNNEKNLGCLGYIGDYTTQSYGDYDKTIWGSL